MLTLKNLFRLRLPNHIESPKLTHIISATGGASGSGCFKTIVMRLSIICEILFVALIAAVELSV